MGWALVTVCPFIALHAQPPRTAPNRRDVPPQVRVWLPRYSAVNAPIMKFKGAPLARRAFPRPLRVRRSRGGRKPIDPDPITVLNWSPPLRA